MKVLIGCEQSGVVRDAFLAEGHDAWSCDLLPAERPTNRHIVGDVRDVMAWDDWDLLCVMHPPCFVAGTLVLTKRGHIPIEDVVIGDEVLTHNARWRRVTEVMRKPATDFVEVKASHGLPTITTPEHPYYTRYREPYRHGCRTKEERDGAPSFVEAGGLTTRHFVASALPPERAADVVDDDLWLMGRYVADGHMRRSRWTPEKWEAMCLSIGAHKFDAFKAECPRQCSIRWHGTAYRATFYGHVRIEMFAQFGKRAHEKHLPEWVLALPKEQAAVFLRGYLSGDGHERERDISAATVSPKLALGVALLMQRVFGKCPSIQTSRRQPFAFIEGRLCNQRDSLNVSVRRSNTRLRGYIDGNLAWGHIRRAEPFKGYADVFNLSVEEDETYTANGLVVHNCTRLCNSGVRWLDKPAKNPISDLTPAEAAAWPTMTDAEKLELTWAKLDEGAALFSACWNTSIPMVALENPVMHKHAKARIENFENFAQSVQPWQFGTDENGPDNEKKRTCFWLRGLPLLNPTGTLDGSTARSSVHHASPGKDRWKERSRFFPGIARAMAQQWGGAALETQQIAA